MYGHESGENPPTYSYKVPEEIRGFIHYFHQHVTEQVEFFCSSMSFSKKLYSVFFRISHKVLRLFVRPDGYR